MQSNDLTNDLTNDQTYTADDAIEKVSKVPTATDAS